MTLYAGTSTTDKLLLAIDKWRYSDSSGEPRTFLSFMKSRDISRGTWARTRGNRLHVKLRNAEVCVKYYTELKCYFTHHTTRDSVFKNTILEALSTDVATHQLTALAIFSLILSRPWMKKLYVAQGTDLTHVGAFKKVKTVIDNLKVFTKDQATFTIQNIDSDLFGEKLERNIMGGGGIEDGDIWLAGPNTILVSRMLFRILEGALSDLKQQYESYLSHSDEDLACLEAATVNTPVHNIAAEQEVGMVSAAKRRAPGATMIFLASTIKSTRNQTLIYLETLELQHQKKRIILAIKLGRNAKEQAVKRGADTRAEIVRRIGVRRGEIVRKGKLQTQRHQQKDRRILESKLANLERAEEWEIKLAVECSDDTAAILKVILGGDIINRVIVHGWFNKETTAIDPWYGVVLSKGRKNYLIRYWNIGGNVEEPEDTAVAPSHLAADLISGDMAFVEGLLKVTVTVGAACYSMMMMMN